MLRVGFPANDLKYLPGSSSECRSTTRASLMPLFTVIGFPADPLCRGGKGEVVKRVDPRQDEPPPKDRLLLALGDRDGRMLDRDAAVGEPGGGGTGLAGNAVDAGFMELVGILGMPLRKNPPNEPLPVLSSSREEGGPWRWCCRVGMRAWAIWRCASRPNCGGRVARDDTLRSCGSARRLCGSGFPVESWAPIPLGPQPPARQRENPRGAGACACFPGDWPGTQPW